MGYYVNPSSEHFYDSLNSKIYVDKSELIIHTNNMINTQQKYICLSRPRRFGKSMAIYMLSAYYNYKIDADELFHGLKVKNDISYFEHKNKYDIIMINTQEFLSKSDTIENMIGRLQKYIIMDFQEEYPNISYRDIDDFTQVFKDVYRYTERKFVILIDEWDCIFREYKESAGSSSDIISQKKYLDFLRLWLKDQPYIGLAYMTGILPVKKYGTHSALNMFIEYSMTVPKILAPHFGFTENEIKVLCEKYNMDICEVKSWYDGYHFQNVNTKISIFSPKSVVESMLFHKLGPYWNRTETYEALKVYIQMNYDGLKDAIITMFAGGSVAINTDTFMNDMTTFSCRDDVLTLLTHLGYLTYDSITSSVSIPNKEVSMEYVNSIKNIGWNEVIRQIECSRKLLEDLFNMDSFAVAQGVERTHNEVSILQYNDENALSYTINLAFYTAREYYTIIRELPSGKGFADICFIPRKMYADKPAIIIELKWNKSVHGAISQIKEKKYKESLKEYEGNLLLVGINYDIKTKKHICEIEKFIG